MLAALPTQPAGARPVHAQPYPTLTRVHPRETQESRLSALEHNLPGAVTLLPPLHPYSYS